MGRHPPRLALGTQRVPSVRRDRLAIVLLSLWGWRRGESWVWWTLAGAATAGFAPAVVAHGDIGYTTLSHLFPVYLGIAFSVVALTLAHPYLCASVTSSRTVSSGARGDGVPMNHEFSQE